MSTETNDTAKPFAWRIARKRMARAAMTFNASFDKPNSTRMDMILKVLNETHLAAIGFHSTDDKLNAQFCEKMWLDAWKEAMRAFEDGIDGVYEND